jgi:hypothetical protein
MLGAAQQLLLLYGNLLQTQQLATSRSPSLLRSYLWFPYGNLLILLGVKPRRLACFDQSYGVPYAYTTH